MHKNIIEIIRLTDKLIMNTSTTIINAQELIHEFILLKNKLIEKFSQSCCYIKDIQYLSDCPREGFIEIDGKKWHFQRHGIGICFTEEKSGKVIDIHEGIFKNKRQLNSWALVQYFESIGVKYINFKNNIFDADNENSLDNLIKALS